MRRRKTKTEGVGRLVAFKVRRAVLRHAKVMIILGVYVHGLGYCRVRARANGQVDSANAHSFGRK
jgi:hypothetical protein